MFATLSVGTRSIEEYRDVVGDAAVDELLALAEPLRGKRVLHLSSPLIEIARGLLQDTVPLLMDLGLNVQWQHVRMPTEFQGMEQDLMSALTGISMEWTSSSEAAWSEFNHLNARLYDEDYDVVVVHQAAIVGLYQAVAQVRGRPPEGAWVWHSHRNFRNAEPDAWSLIRRQTADSAATVFDFPDYARDDTASGFTAVVRPGVDPLSPRLQPMDQEMCRVLLSQRGIDPQRPTLVQITFITEEATLRSLLDMYELVKADRPEAQLVVVNVRETDSASQQHMLATLHRQGEKIGDVLMLSDRDKVGNVEIGALRQQAGVVLHVGPHRGIYTGLLEEMWQAKPIVSSRSPLALAALKEDRTALLADSPIEQAEAVVRILKSPRLAQRLGDRAHAEVAKRYLVTHHLRAYLRLLRRLLSRRSPRQAS